MDFEVDGVLSNVLDISMDKKQAFPGKTNEPAFARFISASNDNDNFFIFQIISDPLILANNRFSKI
jgi:hypothetical protein